MRATNFLAALAFAIAATPAGGAGQDRPGAGVDRERMWWAPTAEDWAKPCLVTWQRTWEDAVALSRETGKAILVCVNMDGEIASEHYAGVRYRQPEIAALYEPYVTVIASVYRHSPRDHDEEGRRVLCPRFGSVTCGEHVAIEPLLYEKFMDGRRIAPRHIGVELDGEEMYDVFYAWDTDTIFDALRDGVANRPAPPPLVRGDRTMVERVASRDVGDREAVERAYLDGDRATRRALLESALVHGDAAPVDLLRLAVFGLDLELAGVARRALAASTAPEAAPLIGEALAVPMEAAEREALVGALERLGARSPAARTLAAVHRGLASDSRAIDVDGWKKALEGAGARAVVSDRSALGARLDYQAAASAASRSDGDAQLALAEALLAVAIEPETDRKYAAIMLEDARRTAREAGELGAKGWRLDAVLALCAFYLGEVEEAHARAETAVDGMPPEAEEWNAMAVLALFAQARQKQVADAVNAKKDWPAQWLTDVHAAYSVLGRHPFGSEHHVVSHYDFLEALKAAGQAERVLADGLARFPDSWVLHERLRARILAEKGAAGLEPSYEALLQDDDAPPNLRWFAGYASLVAAEYHRRARELPLALAAYERAIAHYERFAAAKPEARESCDHYVALAFAARARIASGQNDLDRALTELLASFARRPEAAATPDGLNISPADTARMLRSRLAAAGREDLSGQLEEALSRLDPALLELPAYERETPADRPPRRRRDTAR